MNYRLITALILAVTGLMAAPEALRQAKEFGGAAEAAAQTLVFPGMIMVEQNSKPLRAETQLDAPALSALFVQQSDEFRWRGRVAAGRVVEIKGVNGDVRAEAAAGDEVEIVANKSGRKSDPASVEIKLIEHSDGVTVCAVYPSDDPSRPNECVHGSGGRMNVRDNDVQVNFTVRVPAGVRFVGKTVNGGVEAERLGSDVDVSTVNGSIRASGAGVVSARTVNGSITAAMGRANWPGDLRFESVNGGITLDLPADLSAEVSAETLNGDIETDFSINMIGSVGRRRLNGVIGSGGRKLSLKTVNGSIRLRRAS